MWNLWGFFCCPPPNIKTSNNLKWSIKIIVCPINIKEVNWSETAPTRSLQQKKRKNKWHRTWNYVRAISGREISAPWRNWPLKLQLILQGRKCTGSRSQPMIVLQLSPSKSYVALVDPIMPHPFFFSNTESFIWRWMIPRYLSVGRENKKISL